MVIAGPPSPDRLEMLSEPRRTSLIFFLPPSTKLKHLPSGKLTWQWKLHHLKMYFLLKMGIFQCHVSFLGCKDWGVEGLVKRNGTIISCILSNVPPFTPPPSPNFPGVLFFSRHKGGVAGLVLTAMELPRQGLGRKDLQLPMGHLGRCTFLRGAFHEGNVTFTR